MHDVEGDTRNVSLVSRKVQSFIMYEIILLLIMDYHLEIYN